jgi:hypothetical protein
MIRFGPPGWIAEAGRANLGLYEAAQYAHLDREHRAQVRRSLRTLTIMWGVLCALMPIPVGLISRNAALTTFVAVGFALSYAMIIWLTLSARRELVELDDAEDRATWNPPTPPHER